MKKIQLSRLLLLACVSASSALLQAATVVEIQGEGELSTIMTDGKMARMAMGAGEYVIIDYKKNRVSVVSPQKKEVLLLDAESVAKGETSPKVRVSFRPLGNGQVVAGYKTKRYDYLVNGKSCGVIHGSQGAYQQKGIKELVQAMQTMIEKQQAVMGGFSAFIDDCTQADMQVGSYVQKIGIPMLTEKNGRIESEIKSIRTDVTLPADTFVIPATYKKMTMKDMMNASTKGKARQRPGQNSAPPPGPAQAGGYQQQQMQEMMKQMQQSGQMTPEMMEQMRQAQEMMMRYQGQ